jgi:hypothetical protein
MTELGVGRPRTARPLPFVPPTGDSSPVPPHIQGAEWQTESRARRHTGVRWGLRVLVVGGLAGAAWLLTGAAAHAADRVDGPDGSLLSSIVGADATAPVTGLLSAAAQPLEADRPDHHEHHVVTDILDVPRRAISRPAETVDEVTYGTKRTPVDAALGDVDRVLSQVTGTIRLTGGPETPQQSDVAADVATVDEIPADRPEPSPAELPRQADDKPASKPAPEPAGKPADVAIPATPTVAIPATMIAAVPATITKAPRGHKTSSPSAHRHRHHRVHAAHAAKVVAPETAEEDSKPSGDGPTAPLRLHLGDVSGTPTSSGSGTPTDGGSAAFLPAALANSTMVCHSAAIASDVEARRHDAEAPTVSPD